MARCYGRFDQATRQPGMSKAPVGILLAAGKSTRFGSNKLLHPLTDNRPMLLVSAEKLAKEMPASIVVINEQLIPLSAQLEQMGLRVVVNERAEQGMGSSIACGVGACQDASGWLIMLADMPSLKTECFFHLVFSKSSSRVQKMVGF